MIVDAHQHAFWHGRDDTDLIADMDEQDIDSAWLLTWETPSVEDDKRYHNIFNPSHFRADRTHAGITLADQLRARDHYPDRFLVGYCTHPALTDAAELFEAAYHAYGLHVCGEWKFRMLLDDPRCLELFQTAERLGAPVVLHLDLPYLPDENGRATYQTDWYGGTVANLERALQACPHTNFIGHAPGFWREISGDADSDPVTYPQGPIRPKGRLIQLFESYANLYADLSATSALTALKRDPQHAKSFLTRFADRLLFGRDSFGGDLHEFLRSLELPGEVKGQIYSQNALRLVRADRPKNQSKP